ncbi:hypothetical protein GCM10010965_27450 [Caldalkalibacillus thermarum]|uniref:hypothetical protein n=1 Tax=Caldalkalibacillus thermarum TaxID=296745 RepID=UPI0016630AB6|nr:hypothetical protein [Caldalkalibacillus thermarum]GGK33090.1 hypothetical protein GCM10010965_27450 [Caldalkalibacillus thermarum]
MKNIWEQAERNARERELLNSHVNLDVVNQEEKKANDKGFMIVRKKETDGAGFVQTLKGNIKVLMKKKYLSFNELGFLLGMTDLYELHSNAIINPDTNRFMSVSEIAEYFDRDLSGTSKLINKLIEKGILYELVNTDELREFGRPVTERPLFVNPEIVLCGERNRINATLARLAMRYDKLEKRKIHLEWKVWLHSGKEYGKLVKRKTYLKYKKEQQK